MFNNHVRDFFFDQAAGPVCKLTSTVLSITDDGFLDSSLERSKFRASEMPQVFKYEIIKGAYDKVSASKSTNASELFYHSARNTISNLALSVCTWRKSTATLKSNLSRLMQVDCGR